MSEAPPAYDKACPEKNDGEDEVNDNDTAPASDPEQSDADPPPYSARPVTSLLQRVTDELDGVGRVFNIVTAIKDQLASFSPLETKLPCVVMVGQESTGKSSVLERLTMMPVFPRGDGITTRMPIRFSFKHMTSAALAKWHAAANTAGWVIEASAHGYVRCKLSSESLPDPQYTGFSALREWQSPQNQRFVSQLISDRMNLVSSTDGISEDECVIEAIGPGFPTIDFIDLPGIVSSRRPNEPKDIMEKTLRLSRHYVQQDHTLVVVTETASNKPSRSQAFDLVKDLGKTDVTIGVLTMADEVLASSVKKEALQDLLTNAKPDVELPHGFVAVINRDSRDPERAFTDALYASALDEHALMAQHFPDMVASGLASTEVLLDKIRALMTTYVMDNWVPIVQTQLRHRAASLFQSLSRLGVDPDSGLCVLVIQERFRSVLTQAISKRVIDACSQLVTSTSLGVFQLPDELSRDAAFVDKCRKDAIALPTRVLRLYRQAYTVCSQDTEHPACLNRFTSALDAAADRFQALVVPLKEAAEQELQRVIEPVVYAAYAASTPLDAIATQVRRLCHLIIHKHMVMPLPAVCATFSISVSWTEDPAVLSKRQAIEQARHDIQTAISQLSTQSGGCGSVASPAASVSIETRSNKGRRSGRHSPSPSPLQISRFTTASPPASGATPLQSSTCTSSATSPPLVAPFIFRSGGSSGTTPPPPAVGFSFVGLLNDGSASASPLPRLDLSNFIFALPTSPASVPLATATEATTTGTSAIPPASSSVPPAGVGRRDVVRRVVSRPGLGLGRPVTGSRSLSSQPATSATTTGTSTTPPVSSLGPAGGSGFGLGPTVIGPRPLSSQPAMSPPPSRSLGSQRR